MRFRQNGGSHCSRISTQHFVFLYDLIHRTHHAAISISMPPVYLNGGLHLYTARDLRRFQFLYRPFKQTAVCICIPRAICGGFYFYTARLNKRRSRLSMPPVYTNGGLSG
jgi:hypothetical protein